MRDRGENIDILLARRPDGSLDFLNPEGKNKTEGSALLSFGPLPENMEDRGEGATSNAPLTSDGSSPIAPKGSLPI